MSDEMKTETEEMHYPYVVRGATMYCSCGTHTRKLDMPASHGSYIRDKAMMNRTDCKVGIERIFHLLGLVGQKQKTG